jgi:protein-tyrosine-phosphatase
MKPTEVLFVCVHNAGRSQIAAALLAHYAPEDVVVRSAGSMPAETMNPVAKTALEELGVAILDGIPKKLEDAMVQASDVVITMGCGDA